MNFMSNNRQGFYQQEDTTASRGMSSSSSSLQHQQQIPSPYTLYHHHENTDQDSENRPIGESGSSSAPIEKEHMFDKVVTPSDVGKLNRLVIPKQHAERHFPLDSSTNDKGLLLNFEDRNGKPWRFRYSYWNSSQSYVMTKGWSRFVKEKKLDAGDIVSFQRGLGEVNKDRLFIDWRRRPDAPDILPPMQNYSINPHQFSLQRSGVNPWNPILLHPQTNSGDYYSHMMNSTNPHHQYQYQYHHNPSYGPYSYNRTTLVNGNPCPPGSIVYLGSSPGGGSSAQEHLGFVQEQRRRINNNNNNNNNIGVEPLVFESVPVVQGKAAAKRLRLFGVNMDCPISEADEYHMLSGNNQNSTMPQVLQLIPPHHQYDSSSSVPLLQLGPYNGDQNDGEYEKGKGSTSLNFDI